MRIHHQILHMMGIARMWDAANFGMISACTGWPPSGLLDHLGAVPSNIDVHFILRTAEQKQFMQRPFNLAGSRILKHYRLPRDNPSMNVSRHVTLPPLQLIKYYPGGRQKINPCNKFTSCRHKIDTMVFTIQCYYEPNYMFLT